jgi:hypothetical protein
MPANELRQPTTRKKLRQETAMEWMLENRERTPSLSLSLFIICGGRAKLLISKIIGPLNSSAAHKNPKVIDKPQQLSRFLSNLFTKENLSSSPSAPTREVHRRP